MSVTRFISSKLIKSPSSGKMSRTSNIIAVVSVCVSFAVMIAAVAIVAGFKSEIRSKITGFMGSVTLTQPGMSAVNETHPFCDSLSYQGLIDSLPGVESVSGAAYRSGLVKTADNIEGLCFKGVERDGDINDVTISSSIARKLRLSVGDPLQVYFIGDEVKVRKFKVAGFQDAGLEEIDDKFAYVDIRQIRRINGWGPDDVSSIEIRLDAGADVDRIVEKITEIEAYRSQPFDAPLFVTPVRRYYSHLYDWLALLDLNVLMILVLMIVVAGFNMISAALIILFEKISMIGLLKSLGMTSRQVGRVFLMQSASIVGKGLLLGNVLGIGLCLIQRYTHLIRLDASNYFVDHVPVSLDFWQILLMDAAAFAAIMLIVSLSSRFVARISPDRTLKVE